MKNLLQFFIFTTIICSSHILLPGLPSFSSLLNCFKRQPHKPNSRKIYITSTEEILTQQICLKKLQEKRTISENQIFLITEKISDNIEKIRNLDENSLKEKIKICQKSTELLEKELAYNDIMHPDLKSRWKEQIIFFKKHEFQLQKEFNKQQN